MYGFRLKHRQLKFLNPIQFGSNEKRNEFIIELHSMNRTSKSNSLRHQLFIVEGPDGSGKSTIAKNLNEHLTKRNIKTSMFTFPGSKLGTLGKIIYDIHHDPSRYGIDSIVPISLQMLHVAAHIDIIENAIIPALKSGEAVILDRYWWSTWVYGIVMGANRASLKKLIEVELIHWADIEPTAIFLLRRSLPTDQPTSSVQGNRIKIEYEKLARREQKRYNVQVVDNDGTVANSLRQLLEAIKFGKGDEKYYE